MRTPVLVCILAALVVMAGAASGDDLQTLVDQAAAGSDEARLQVIHAGLPAIPALVNVVNTQDGRPADRAARTIGWIIEFAGTDPAQQAKAEWAAVNLLVDPTQPVAVRAAAARNLHHVASDKSVGALASLIGDEALTTEVLWSLENISEPAALIALTKAYGEATGPTKVAALGTIGRRTDAPLGLLEGAARSSNPALQIAAFDGLGRLGSPAAASAIELLLPRCEGDVEVAALLAYLRLADTARMRGESARAAVMYRRVLGLGLHSPDNVQAKALSGLGKTGNAGDVPLASPYLIGGTPAVQVAAAGALARLPGKGATAALAAALADATPQQARPVLSALIERADPAVVSSVIPVARVGNIDLQLLALQALGAMGDAAACQVILAVYQNPRSTDRLRTVAFDSYTAIGAAQLAAGRPDKARAIYESAMQMAKTEPQKITALEGAGAVASPRSLPALGVFTHAEGRVQAAAVEAYVGCADTLAAAGDRDGAKAALMTLLDVVSDEAQTLAVVTRLGALGSSVDVGSRLGFVTHWWVIGPFPSGPEFAGTDEVLFPEEKVDLTAEGESEGRKLRWAHQHSLSPDGMLDYAPMFRKNTDALCYSCAEVTLDEPTDARLHCGSDDSIVVWLNGEEVHRFKGPRGLKVGEDRKDIALNAGVNTLLIKVIQGGGDWSSSVQLTDREDKPLTFEQKTK